VHLNVSKDTSELACDSIELWFNEQGRKDYTDASELLVLCDGGGSNSATHFIFIVSCGEIIANCFGLERWLISRFCRLN